MALTMFISLVACATYSATDDPETLGITQEDFDALQIAHDSVEAERDALAAEVARLEAEAAAREAESDKYAYDVYAYDEADVVETQGSESVDSDVAPAAQEQQAQPPVQPQPAQQPAQEPAPQAQLPQANTAVADIGGTDVFAGVNVTVNDTSTVATTSGMPGVRATVFNFLSVDGRVLGSISVDDYALIMERNNIRDGGEQWFADEFNRLRGLTQSAGDAFIEANAERQERYRRELIRLVNIERERAGLHPYVMNQELMRFSQVRARELATQYSHTRPDGSLAGFEIIAQGQLNPERAVNAWLGSAGHRAAILDPELTLVGAGVYISQGTGIRWQMYFDFNNLSLIEQTSH